MAALEPIKRAAVICVGNKLMLDDGIGPAVYEYLLEHYEFPNNVDLFDVGCMSLDMISKVRDYDFIMSVDAVEVPGQVPGTVFRFQPDDISAGEGIRTSLHDLKLIDLFNSAALLGYECDGICFGMQAENIEPAEFTIGLTPKCYDALPLLAESIVAELTRRGYCS